MLSLSRLALGNNPKGTKTPIGGGDGTDSPADPLLDRIGTLWESAHKGIYRPDPRSSTTRLDLLEALGDGAGASILEKKSVDDETFHFLGPLSKALAYSSRPSYNNALDNLRLHRDGSHALKTAVIEILEAYMEVAKVVDQIEKTLREKQIGFREPTEMDWAKVWGEMKSLVEATGNKLLHYHAKMRVLQLDVERDAVVRELSRKEEEWVVFRYILYPRPSRGISSFTGSSSGY